MFSVRNLISLSAKIENLPLNITFCIDAGTPETKRETLKTSGAFTLSVNTASALRQR